MSRSTSRQRTMPRLRTIGTFLFTVMSLTPYALANTTAPEEIELGDSAKIDCRKATGKERAASTASVGPDQGLFTTEGIGHIACHVGGAAVIDKMYACNGGKFQLPPKPTPGVGELLCRADD